MRGRGGGRGRGRGRRGGSAGRGRGGGRGRGTRGWFNRTDDDEQTGEGAPDSKDESKDLDINKDVRAFFVGSVSVAQHLKGQTDNRDRYAAGMAVLEKNGVEVSQNARVRALAASWARHDHNLASAFLENRDSFGVVEVYKALVLLDSGRRMRVLEKKVKRLQLSNAKVKPKTLGKLKSDIDNLRALKPPTGSASGAVCKHVRNWVQQFTKADLEFFALHFPTETWKNLADICHFNPKQDFPAAPWFLSYCFGDPAPDDNIVSHCRDVTEENVNDLVKEYDVPYSHIKEYKAKLTDDSKARIASYETKIDTVLWYYEELQCEEVDKIIHQRILDGQEVTLPNGKLLERLLTLKMIRENIPARRSYYTRNIPRQTTHTKAPFLPLLIPLAEKKMKDISLPLESPIVVIGDASGSMEVAIRTSSIIAGLLTALTSAELAFFNTQNIKPPYVPKTIEEVLELAATMKATGGTAPAASLYPYYSEKRVVKTFIVVTDEEENQGYQNEKFCPLFKKYHDEVFPAKLVFVSFLRGQHTRGQMVTELEGMDFKPLQFKLDGSRPDLTKLDNLFGLLSAESASFDDEVTVMENKIREKGLQKVFEALVV